MPPGLHAALARAAEREGTSLNGYIIARLTSSVGWVPAEAEDGSETAPAAGHPQRTLTWLLAANVAAVSLAAIAAIAILLAVWLA